MSTNQPLVSVIMNCYNGEEFLESAINSVFAQTYKNWELIFWNNCSTDHTCEIVNRFNDPRVCYFESERHTSLGEARNLAMEKANGKYIAFLDVDDTWLPSFLSRGISIFQQFKDISVFCSNYYQFNDHSQWIINNIANDQIYSFPEILRSYTIGMSSSIVDNTLLNSEKIFFNTKYSLIEDFDFFLRISYLKPIYYCCEPLMQYRMHTNSLTFRMRKGWWEELTDLYTFLTTKLLTKEETEKNANSLQWLKVRIINAKINDAIGNNNKKAVLKLVSKNFFMSYKLLFPLIYIVIGKDLYYKFLNLIRGNIYRT